MQARAFRWYGVITLFVIVAISYVDRINIAVLITDPAFLAHIGITREDRVSQGLLATAFMVGYGVSAFVLTPFCAALFGVRRSLILGLSLWGVVTFITPWFDGYGMLLASRVLLGVSEGPLFSLASSYIKAHFESHENGKPNSFVNMGTGLGLALGYPLIGFMLAHFHWETSFYVLGLINVALGIPLVVAFVKMPTAYSSLKKPKSFGDALTHVGDIVKGALQTRYLVLITVLTSATLAYLWGGSNWLPTYLKEARGFSLKEMGWLASLPQYATVAAVLLGGVIIDKIERQRVPFIFMVASAGVALMPDTCSLRSRSQSRKPQANTTIWVPMSKANPAKKPDAAPPDAPWPPDIRVITPPIKAGMKPATRLPVPLTTPKALATCSGREQYWTVLGIAGL